MAIARVSGSFAHAFGTGTALSVATGVAVTAGNQLPATILTSAAVTLSNVTDDKGNNWTIDAGPSTSGNTGDYVWFAHCENAFAGVTTVTAHFASSVSASISIQEVSGLKATSYSAYYGTNGYGTVTSNPFTPASVPAFGVGVLNSGGQFATVGATNGWTDDYQFGYNNYDHRMSLIMTAGGSYDLDGTHTADNGWDSRAAVYLGGSSAVTHATSGVLTGSGAIIAGTSAHKAKHATSGVLVGQGAVVAGTARRYRLHGTSGVLTGQGAAIAGSARRFRLHATTGALTGQGSSVAGVARRYRLHATSGVLTGQGSVVAGTSAHKAKHTTSGSLIGQGAVINGAAQGSGTATVSDDFIIRRRR